MQGFCKAKGYLDGCNEEVITREFEQGRKLANAKPKAAQGAWTSSVELAA